MSFNVLAKAVEAVREKGNCILVCEVHARKIILPLWCNRLARHIQYISSIRYVQQFFCNARGAVGAGSSPDGGVKSLRKLLKIKNKIKHSHHKNLVKGTSSLNSVYTGETGMSYRRFGTTCFSHFYFSLIKSKNYSPCEKVVFH